MLNLVKPKGASSMRVFFSAIIALWFAAIPEVWAISPDDYDVPVSTAQQFRLGGNYAYSGAGGSTQTNDGAVSLAYSRYFNSLPYAWDINLHGVGATRRTGEGVQEKTYSLVAGPGIRKYFDSERDIFYSGDLRATANSDFDRPTVEITPGIGYGRFIRVTPLAQALRIQEFLLAEGVIVAQLPEETLIGLAQILERQGEYETQFGDRYKVKWFEDMEGVIAASGMFVGEGLGAVGSLRIDEVLFQEHVNERFVGWDIRTGIRFEMLTRDSMTKRQDPGLSIRLRYSRPAGWKSQFDVSLQYTSPFSGDFGTDVFTFYSSVNYLYEVTNRIDFTVSNIVTAARSVPGTRATVVGQVRSGFIFFIENQVNLNVTGTYSRERGTDPALGLNLALEYRLR